MHLLATSRASSVLQDASPIPTRVPAEFALLARRQLLASLYAKHAHQAFMQLLAALANYAPQDKFQLSTKVD